MHVADASRALTNRNKAGRVLKLSLLNPGHKLQLPIPVKRCMIQYAWYAIWPMVQAYYLSALPVLCVCKNTETEEATMMNQLPVTQCRFCGGEDIRVGWQSDALVTFKRNGLLGNRIKFLICGNCGAIRYQCVAEPHRFPQAR